MMNLINKKKAEQGFTLIELMIVIAIIGILAAIALPQFAAYRMRAFNSTGEADARNLSASAESVFADYNEYASSRTAAATPTVANASTYIVNNQWIGTSSLATGNVNEYLQITLSNQVTGLVAASGTGPGGIFDSSIGCAKHFQGDRMSAFDTDSNVAYFRIDSANYPNVLTSAGTPAADCNAVAAAASVRVDNLAALGTWRVLQQ